MQPHLQAQIMLFLSFLQRKFTTQIDALIGRFGTSMVICHCAGRRLPVLSVCLPSGVKFLNILILCEGVPLRLFSGDVPQLILIEGLSYPSLPRFATRISQKPFCYFVICAALLRSLRIFTIVATPCANRLELRFVLLLISPSFFDCKPCAHRVLSRKLLGFSVVTTVYVQNLGQYEVCSIAKFVAH